MAGLGNSNHIYTDLATGQGPVSAASRTRSNSAFIPELWSDEIIAAYKSNLVMAPLCVNMNHVGKKGDTIHVPRPVRGSASEKAEQTQVNLIQDQATQTPYLIDQHWEYSRLIEDVVAMQADDSIRAFYTDDAGYALATQVDSHMHTEAARLNAAGATPTSEAGSDYAGAVIGSDGNTAWDGSASGSTGNGTALADAGIRKAIQHLDDNDTPTMGRVLVIPPVEKNNLLGEDRFTEQAFVGEVGANNSIRNGRIGNIYGVEVYVSTNCATVQADDTSTNYRACLLFQKEALLLIEQMRLRSQTQYKQEWLADLFTADLLYGRGILRPEAGIPIIVPA